MTRNDRGFVQINAGDLDYDRSVSRWRRRVILWTSGAGAALAVVLLIQQLTWVLWPIKISVRSGFQIVEVVSVATWPDTLLLLVGLIAVHVMVRMQPRRGARTAVSVVVVLVGIAYLFTHLTEPDGGVSMLDGLWNLGRLHNEYAMLQGVSGGWARNSVLRQLRLDPGYPLALSVAMASIVAGAMSCLWRDVDASRPRGFDVIAPASSSGSVVEAGRPREWRR